MIARILPGFFFFVFLFFNLPGLKECVDMSPIDGSNFVDKLVYAIFYAAVCYFLGWLFLALTWRAKRLESIWGSKREKVRDRHTIAGAKSPSEKYQRIRIAHPVAGFRIVKLRAEARMLEATRTAMVVIMIITVVYLGIMLGQELRPNHTVSGIIWARSCIGLSIAVITCNKFRKYEGRAWKSYYGNIDSIYEIH